MVFNAGIDNYQKYGALMYFGSDESLAGQSAGQRLAEGVAAKQGPLRGPRAGQELARDPLRRGEEVVREHREPPGQRADLPAVHADHPGQARPGPVDHRHRHPRRRRRRRRRPGPGTPPAASAKIVTFDLSPEVVQAIKDKKIEFCVDQQPYLQGYEAVDSLWLNLTNGNDIGGGKPTLTGPSFVDATNIDKIAGFAANNTR